eukprot:4686486-Amphidinium_carterae.1
MAPCCGLVAKQYFAIQLLSRLLCQASRHFSLRASAMIQKSWRGCLCSYASAKCCPALASAWDILGKHCESARSIDRQILKLTTGCQWY